MSFVTFRRRGFAGDLVSWRMRRRLTVISSLERRFSSRATMTCSWLFSSNCWARACAAQAISGLRLLENLLLVGGDFLDALEEAVALLADDDLFLAELLFRELGEGFFCRRFCRLRPLGWGRDQIQISDFRFQNSDFRGSQIQPQRRKDRKEDQEILNRG